jgi:hypothetical protein
MKPRQLTEKQREAARTNGARSSGPVTARGKYNSSRNSARHNLLAQTVVLEAEAPDRFLALMDALKEEHQPRTTTEVLLVESMAIARWRLTRVWGAQKTAMDRDMAQLDPNAGPAAVRVVLSMRPSTEVPVELLLRYEAMFERQFSRALRSLNQSQARRTGYETEPYFPQAPSAGTLKEETATAKRSPEVIEITSPGLDLPPARKSKSLSAKDRCATPYKVQQSSTPVPFRADYRISKPTRNEPNTAPCVSLRPYRRASGAGRISSIRPWERSSH